MARFAAHSAEAEYTMGMSTFLARIFFPPPGVKLLRQSRSDNCVQTVLAMSLELPIETIEAVAGTQGQMEVGEINQLLAKLGVFYRPVSASLMADCWPSLWHRSGGRKLRGMAVKLPRGGVKLGHAYFVAGAIMYDPATGRTRTMNPSTLDALDLIVLFPSDIYDNPALGSLRRALAGIQVTEQEKSGDRR